MIELETPKLAYIQGQKIAVCLSWVCANCGFVGHFSKLLSRGDVIDCSCPLCGASPIEETKLGGQHG